MAAGTGDDEEEKTTIESGWEEEPSTTIAQGEVAEQIRALGNDPPRRTGTNVTATNAGMVDELTVDDQHANAALSLITPAMLQARLVVTGGNDTGQEVAVQPGKTYTIGRAVENDIVLTDIAVSRKHFDLRHEAGTWVLVDRGSGNGTLVNGNLEDHPFMLANGDAIEIGNTTFRFELPNGAPRVSSYEVSVDEAMPTHGLGNGHNGHNGHNQHHDDEEEEEPSTVAGKPIRDELSTPSHIPMKAPPPVHREPPQRAKTMPPPAPLRPRSPSVQPSPAASYPPQHLGPMPGMSASMTNPMGGAMPATTQPLPQQMNGRGAQAPTMLGDQMGMPAPGMMPTTIPGQGPPPPQQQQQHYNPYPAQPQNGMPPQNLAQMLVINGMPPGRDATSTALVPPTPYNGMPVMLPPQPAYVAPAIPRKTKLILGGAGLTLFAAIATVAIIKGAGGGGGSAPKTEPSKGSATTVKASTTESSANDAPKKVTVQPIVTPAKTEPPKTDTKLATAIKGDTPKVEPIKTEPVKTVAPKVEPIKVEPAKVEPIKVEPAKVEPKVAPVRLSKKEQRKRDLQKKKEQKLAKKEPTPRPDPPDEPIKKEPAPKKVAMGDIDGLRSKADSLYKAKKFTEAANVLLSASKSSGEPEQAKDLRLKAGYYASFGKKYNTGMAPATSAKDAWAALTAARTFDNSLGGNYTSEINARMGAIAPKAAVAFMAGKDYVKAKQAVGIAESSGNGNSTTQGVRSSLEQKAGEIYKEAQSLKSSDPDAAKQKFREIQRIVDSKSSWYQKAGKALSGN